MGLACGLLLRGIRPALRAPPLTAGPHTIPASLERKFLGAGCFFADDGAAAGTLPTTA